MGREVSLNQLPKRIISLVPSQTELLYDLGLQEEVVGQTLFCIHPAEQHALKPRIGGTKKLNIQKIRELQPDIIIGNKEENEKSQVEALMQEFPVWMSDIKNLEQALHMIQGIGELVGKENKAKEMVHEIAASFAHLVQTEKKYSAIYLIWREPWMAVGSDTFIGSLLEKMGIHLQNPAQMGRYPEIDAQWIQRCGAENILLSSEPYPFKTKHIEELQQLLPQARIQLVDGELFSWYGSRLRHSAKYLKELQSSLL